MILAPSLPRKPTLASILLAALWLLSLASGILAALTRLDGFAALCGLASFAFIIALIWSLSRQPPHAADLPELDFSLHRLRFSAALGLLLAGILVVFVLGMSFGPGTSIMLACALLGLALAISWRSRLAWPVVAAGLAVGLFAALGVMLLGEADPAWAAFNLLALPPAFVGGALLVERTGLGRVRLLRGEYALALKGFLWACVLALPAALLNLLGKIYESDTWVAHAWQPLYAIVPGVAEETWARLFILPFCCALLGPTVKARPRRAVLIAVLASALVHGFAHTGIDPFGLVIGSLLYGLPTALLFLKADFEHAVGYHFFVDFVRYLAAYLLV
jgi:hypothetical protein